MNLALFTGADPMRTALLTWICALVGTTGSASAQPATSLAELPRNIDADDAVRATDSQGRTVRGRLVQIDASDIALLSTVSPRI